MDPVDLPVHCPSCGARPIRRPMPAPDDLDLTLDLNCADCGGALTAQFRDWLDDQLQELSEWVCPFCRSTNMAHFPGRLIWVTKRERAH